MPSSATQLEIAQDVVERASAVVGGAPRPVPLHEPVFEGNEWLYLKDCLDTGWVSSVGSYVDRFERDLGALTGGYAVAVVNGTAALQVCLQLVGVGRGDEVLIPALTFIATANAVSYCGAIPHFVDSETTSLGISAEALSLHLDRIAVKRDGGTYNRKTGHRIAALMPMHCFGRPVDLDALADVARTFGLALVEDAAESLGSSYKGRQTGTLGLVGGMSFNGNKVVTTGGGGAVLTRDANLAKRAKHLSTTARTPHRWSFVHDEVGYNFRMPNINAALGCAQLERLNGWVSQKRNLADLYAKGFDGFSHGAIFREPAYSQSNYWLNVLLLNQPDLELRDAILQATNDAGLQTRPAWTLMHRLPIYADCPRMELPVAESLEKRIVCLPSSARLGR